MRKTLAVAQQKSTAIHNTKILLNHIPVLFLFQSMPSTPLVPTTQHTDNNKSIISRRTIYTFTNLFITLALYL